MRGWPCGCRASPARRNFRRFLEDVTFAADRRKMVVSASVSAGHVGIEIQIDDRVFLRALRTQGQPIGTNLTPLAVPHYTHVLDR